MKRQQMMMVFSLLLLLITAACGQAPTQPTGDSPVTPETTSVPTETVSIAPTQAPTHAPTATATAAPVQEPTHTPTTAPTEAPTDAPAPTSVPRAGILPLDSPWIGLPDTLLVHVGNLQRFVLAEQELPSPSYFWTSAENGAAVAYREQQGTLVVVDTASGSHFTLPEIGDTVAGFSFSQDGSALAYTEIGSDWWQLKLREQGSGATHVLQEGKLSPSEDGSIEGVLSPITWVPQGLLAERLTWGSDAPPSRLSLVNVVDGSVQVLREEPYVAAYPARDGRKIALVTGQMMIGGPSELGLSVFDVGAGEREIVPGVVGIIDAVQWSPDGSRLVYHLAPEGPVTSLVMVNADGSGERRIELGAGVAGGGRNVRFMDAVWSQQARPLLLIADEAQQLRLFQLSEAAFDTNFAADSAQEIASYGPLPEERTRIPIVYAP